MRGFNIPNLSTDNSGRQGHHHDMHTVRKPNQQLAHLQGEVCEQSTKTERLVEVVECQSYGRYGNIEQILI